MRDWDLGLLLVLLVLVVLLLLVVLRLLVLFCCLSWRRRLCAVKPGGLWTEERKLTVLFPNVLSAGYTCTR